MVRFFRLSFELSVMAMQDLDKQKSALEKTMQKFAELLPSVKPETSPVEKALVVIDGTAKSKAAVLCAGELNRNFGTKIDVICFYTKQPPENSTTSKESYEDSLSFAFEHLKSEDFEIKGEVVEDIDNLRSILDNVIMSVNYDVIIVPSSFIGLREVRIERDEEEDTEASITVLGALFDYLLEDIKEIPILLVESEKINLNLLWKNTCIFFTNPIQLPYLFEKALKYSLKKSEIHCLINIDPSYHEDKSQEEFDAFIKKTAEELERFEKANSEVFKEASRYVETHFLTTDKIEVLKQELTTFGKDTGVLIIYMPSKHSSLYGFFTDILEDPEITFPILIAKRKIDVKKEELKGEEVEKEEIGEVEAKEELERKEEEIPEKEEKIVIDESLKKSIKEEVKKDILGITDKEKEEKEVIVKEKEEIEEVKERKKEDIKEVKEKKKEEDEEEVEEMKEIDEIKEEVKEEVIEEIKKEVVKEVKAEPKKEVKKEVSKELKSEESLDELKEEIKYELKKDLKEPKKELKEKVIEEIKEIKIPEEEIEEEISEEEKEEEEAVTSRNDFE